MLLSLCRMGGGCLLPCLLILAFLKVLTVGSVEASIHIYDGESFREVGSSYLFSGKGSEAILASRFPTPLPRLAFSSTVRDGLSYIRFENITFWRSKAVADRQYPNIAYSSGLVQVVIFEAADGDNIGSSRYGGQRSICCTPNLAKLEGCKQGKVIRLHSSTDVNWPIVLDVHFKGNLLSAQMENTNVFVKKTGMYNLFFIACEPKLKGMTITGKTLWKNPDGYLPERMAPLMKFYVIVSVVYAFLCGFWFARYVRYWKDVLPLQHCITVVIALGLLEMVLWYFDFANFNTTGIRPTGTTTLVVTIGSVRKALQQLPVLSAAMYFGVLHPTLGGHTTKFMLLGIIYFSALSITEYVGTISDIALQLRVLVLPEAMLDAFLILWIFTSLSKTFKQLQAKRSSMRLDMYKKFLNAFAITVFAFVAWIAYEVDATDHFNEKWEAAWIITVFWDTITFALISLICYLWSPSQSSQLYCFH